MQIVVNQSGVKSYFKPYQLDGLTPSLVESGGQPQISINGGVFTSTGISTLTHIGFGKYYATLDPAYITTVGDVILTRYKSGVTTETEGSVFEVVGIPTDPSFNALINQSYVTVNEANTFFANRLKTEVWNDSSFEDRRKSLIQATGRIERLNFAGSRYNANQILQFPRGVDTEIPEDIKIATFLIAIKLLDEIDIDTEIDNTMMNANGYHQARTSYDRSYIQEHILAGIPSAEAWQHLKPYLASYRDLEILRST